MIIERVAYNEPELSIWVKCVDDRYPVKVESTPEGGVIIEAGLFRVVLSSDEAAAVGAMAPTTLSLPNNNGVNEV